MIQYRVRDVKGRQWVKMSGLCWSLGYPRASLLSPTIVSSSMYGISQYKDGNQYGESSSVLTSTASLRMNVNLSRMAERSLGVGTGVCPSSAYGIKERLFNHRSTEPS